MIVDYTYTYTAPEVCALTFECNACGQPLRSTEQHRRADTHTVVNGQRIGRTYFFHLACTPAWATSSTV